MKRRALGSILLCWLILLAIEAGTLSGWGAEAPKSGAADLKYEEPRYLTGAIYAHGPGPRKLLFNFKRTASRAGERLNVRRDYTYPDGSLAAQEIAVYKGNDLVFYELKELQIGAMGSATITHAKESPGNGRIEFEYTKSPGAKPKSKAENLTENTLNNDMVGPFLVSHWDTLARGEKLKCRYLVVPRMETVGFTFVKDSESTWQGRKVLIVRMETSSRLLAARSLKSSGLPRLST